MTKTTQALSHETIPIPPEFASQLRLVSSLDKRTDDEIFASLKQHVPVTTEKNIWAFWDKGLSAMPAWCRRNVLNWVRLNGPDWTVRVLDDVPESPNHALKFVDAGLLPDSFVRKTMDGPYVGPHSADFLRTACLLQHGGVFMDVGILLVRKLDDVCWNVLEKAGGPYRVAIPWMYGQVTANHFVAARKGDPFVQRWHEFFIHLWRDRTNHEGIISNPLIAFSLTTTDFSEAEARGFKWEFSVTPATIFQYISQVVSFQRVAMLEAGGDGFNGVEYWMRKIYLFDSLVEDWAAEAEIGYSGKKLFSLLRMQRELGTQNKEQHEEAYRMTWRILASACMQKVTHAKKLTTEKALGILWDEEENEGADYAQGTFAGLLRYGSVCFEQTRKGIAVVDPPEPKVKLTNGLYGE